MNRSVLLKVNHSQLPVGKQESANDVYQDMTSRLSWHRCATSNSAASDPYLVIISLFLMLQQLVQLFTVVDALT